VSSDGELEPEVDENKIVTDQDRADALELKANANKAFASKSSTVYTKVFAH
jgi:serine/threonine-protein phosphatase 5